VHSNVQRSEVVPHRFAMRRLVSRATSILMTLDEIREELGWSDDMVRRYLRIPDVPTSIRGKHTSERYYRERVLATAQTREARVSKLQWDETLRGHTPNSGWTSRLGDIGAVLGISAVAVGKILELLGYRLDKCVTETAVAAGCGVRRWDGYALHSDWHLDRVVSAIGRTVEVPDKPAVADALAAALAKQDARERVASRKRRHEEMKAKMRLEEELVISGLQVELQALRASDPGISLLTAVEYITSDAGRQVVLYRRCSLEDWGIGFSCIGQDNPHLSASRDLALLDRRARAEGHQV
jgi:hypothetical protein